MSSNGSEPKPFVVDLQFEVWTQDAMEARLLGLRFIQYVWDCPEVMAVHADVHPGELKEPAADE